MGNNFTPDLTLAELSKIVRLTPVRLRQLAQKDELPGAYKIGRRTWVFRRECLDQIRGLAPNARRKGQVAAA